MFLVMECFCSAVLGLNTPFTNMALTPQCKVKKQLKHEKHLHPDCSLSCSKQLDVICTRRISNWKLTAL